MSIDLTVEDGIALITFNRPNRLNAMDAAHYQALSDAWTRVRDDPQIRVALVTGAGDRAFSVGADLKSFVTRAPKLAELMPTQRGQLLNYGLEVWKPVVTAVNGFCLGGGMTLLLATDIRIAATHATFGVSEVKRGIFAANGGHPADLPAATSFSRHGDSSDRRFDRCPDRGAVGLDQSRGTQGGSAEGDIRGRAKNRPQCAARRASDERAGPAQSRRHLATGPRLEQLILRLPQGSDDVTEGARAFVEKRTPEFKGQ